MTPRDCAKPCLCDHDLPGLVGFTQPVRVIDLRSVFVIIVWVCKVQTVSTHLRAHTHTCACKHTLARAHTHKTSSKQPFSFDHVNLYLRAECLGLRVWV